MHHTVTRTTTAFKICMAFCGGLVVKASASQLGGRRFESHRVQTDMAGWLAAS